MASSSALNALSNTGPDGPLFDGIENRARQLNLLGKLTYFSGHLQHLQSFVMGCSLLQKNFTKNDYNNLPTIVSNILNDSNSSVVNRLISGISQMVESKILKEYIPGYVLILEDFHRWRDGIRQMSDEQFIDELHSNIGDCSMSRQRLISIKRSIESPTEVNIGLIAQFLQDIKAVQTKGIEILTYFGN